MPPPALKVIEVTRIRHAVGLHENADHAALDLGTTVHMHRL
jgi:hypothetical protein